jgi:hypothetical protein
MRIRICFQTTFEHFDGWASVILAIPQSAGRRSSPEKNSPAILKNHGHLTGILISLWLEK